ncbi:MAG: DUF1015 domain-containing protein [Cytophagales bacterium]|nr:DUF1015 domain-containing protein [Cytophagales bacterium]
MAIIKPFRAWRYGHELQEKISELTSPLFDVVSDKQRENLYANPINSIHLSVPSSKDPVMDAKARVSQWKLDGTIIQDNLPTIYVYYQYFTLPGRSEEICRKGFIANLKIYDWDENVLLRHEDTMPHSVNDRIEVLDATQMNIAPTHGLFTDESNEIETYLEQSMQSPLYEAEDYQGVRDVLSVIHDASIIKRITEIMTDKKVILADGHHRYESSLQYQIQQEAANKGHTGLEGYNYHLMYFTNTEADDLRILPTHRLISNLFDFDEYQMITDLSKYFNVTPIENVYELNEVILGKKWAFGILIGDNAYKIRLKEGMINEMPDHLPKAVRFLDNTVMHFFVFDKVLGIPLADQRNSTNLSFDRNFGECVSLVSSGTCQMAVITQDISIEKVKEVCYSGHTLPQKSTYFYPKVICGFLFGSIHPDEFDSPFDPAFR